MSGIQWTPSGLLSVTLTRQRLTRRDRHVGGFPGEYLQTAPVRSMPPCVASHVAMGAPGARNSPLRAICAPTTCEVQSPRKTTMRRTILMIIAVFLIGLVTVVAVGAWNLSAIRDTIVAERDGNTALYRLGGQAHHQVQAIEVAVDSLFKGRTAADLEAAAKDVHRLARAADVARNHVIRARKRRANAQLLRADQHLLRGGVGRIIVNSSFLWHFAPL